MGFHLGVSSIPNDIKAFMACREFIDKSLYQWVSEYEHLGENSCIAVTGKYFNLNLKPLAQLIYTGGDLDDAYLASGLQKSAALISLLDDLIKCIETDSGYIDKIDYSYEGPNSLETLSSKNDAQHPWGPFVKDGELSRQLSILRNKADCYLQRGHEEVILTAG